MRPRELAALGALALAGAFFAGPSHRLSRTMLEARARSSTAPHLRQVVAGVVAAAELRPELLPSGEEARSCAALLRKALSEERIEGLWPLQAVALLDADQLAVLRSAPHRAPLARSREHPEIPGEMLRMYELLEEDYGDAGDPPPLPEPALPWPGTGPQDLVRGLLHLVETGDPRLGPEQAAGLRALLLAGISAHAGQPEMVEELGRALGPEILAMGRRAEKALPGVDLAGRYGPAALAALGGDPG